MDRLMLAPESPRLLTQEPSPLMFTPEPLIKARCVICNKYLSVTPILSSTNGKVYKCGRCTEIHLKYVNTKLPMLDEIFKYFSFPCIYRNCKQQIRVENVVDHEKSCEKRTVLCPVEACDDIVLVYDITSHFEAKHNSIIYYEEFNATPLKTYNSYVFLLIKDNSPFYIYLRLGHKVSWVAVFSHAQPFDPNLKFKIKITDKNGAHLIVDDQQVQAYDEREHCYKCIIAKCKAKYHKYSALYSNHLRLNNIMTQFNSEYMAKICEFGTLLYSIEVYRDKEQVEDLQRISIQKLAYNSNILRENLECPVCKLYMTSPIFLCQRGHVICRSCKRRCQSCPTCRAHFANSRIYALEEIADHAEFLCQNQENGCTFIGKGKRTEEHELKCSYSNKCW